jgi:hypothetical protein
MGFFTELGNLAGTIAGGVIGGAIGVIGDVVDSDFIKEVGEGVYHASKNAGNIVGQAVEGAVTVAEGIITSEDEKIEEGLNNIGEAGTNFVSGVGNGVKAIITNGGDVIDGISQGDSDKVFEASKNIIKIGAVAHLAFGVSHYIGGIDGLDHHVADAGHITDASHVSDVHTISDVSHVSDTHPITDAVHSGSSTDMHYVHPHHVNSYDKADGTHVNGYWRDGDGDTTVNLSENQGGGYMSHNS